MKKVLIFILTLIILIFGNTFIKTFGGIDSYVGLSVEEAIDDGYIICGTSSDSTNTRFSYVIKTDLDGNFEWSSTYGDTLNTGTIPKFLKVDNGYLILLSNVLLKIDSLGNELWVKNLSTYYRHLTHAVGEGIILTGAEGALLKLDDNGNEIWQVTLGDRSYGYVCKSVDNGYFLLTGYPGIEHEVTIQIDKTDSLGNQIWRYSLTGDMNAGESVHATSDGGCTFLGTDDWLDVFFKLSSTGTLEWEFVSMNNEFYSAIVNNDSTFILAGRQQIGNGFSGPGMTKIDKDRNIVFEKTFTDTSGVFYDGKITSDNGYIFTGYTWKFDSPNPDIILVKTDSDGDVTSIYDDQNTIKNHELLQNYPNPFNPVTTIEYSLKKSALVNLKIFDIKGREVTCLIDKKEQIGLHKIDFNGSDLTSGIYFYTLSIDGQIVENKKMMLLK